MVHQASRHCPEMAAPAQRSTLRTPAIHKHKPSCGNDHGIFCHEIQLFLIEIVSGMFDLMGQFSAIAPIIVSLEIVHQSFAEAPDSASRHGTPQKLTILRAEQCLQAASSRSNLSYLFR